MVESENEIHELSEDHYVPHYQPIVNTVTRNIMGYEVLGRFLSPESQEYMSLGPLFHGPEANKANSIHIDKIIREKAVSHLKESGSNTKLFFNMMPNFLSMIHKEDLLDPGRFHIIQMIEKYGIDKRNIVIEITEDEFKGEIERLLLMVNIFRNYGFKIAIDDLGVGSSNLERIGYIHPDIIKVDINIMRESLNRNSFRQVLNAISEMSLKLGSELLFEGIETEEELTLALSMGSSLLQGFYFSKATKEFQNKSQFSKNLKVILEKFSGLRFLELVQNCQKEQAIIDSLTEIFDGIHDVKEDALYEPVFQTLKVLPPEIKSVIVCDLHGYQLSPTFERKDTGDWKEIVSDIGNNFAWKPYFIQHKAERYHYHKKWGVTDQLYDIQSQKKYVIFTFSLSETIVLMARIDWV